jgi:hypothetical protein
MPHRDELHRLIELIPAHELHTAMRFMQFLCGVGPHAAQIIVVDDPDHAPDAPETPEEQAAWRDYEANLAKLPPLDREIEAIDPE